MIRKTLLFFVLMTSLSAAGQKIDSLELYATIKEKDSLLFNVGFNTCNIQLFEMLISENFEFFHDQAGITHSKAEFISGIKNGLCKLPYKPKRVLDSTKMEVFPLKKEGVLYGAIQTGEHHFYAIEDNTPEYLTSIAKFTHVWLLMDNEWKLTKGLSYDHRDF